MASYVPRSLLISCSVGILVAWALGQRFDPHGFWINVAAGLFWWALAFLLGSLFIDKVLRRYRDQQWAKVKSLTCRAIANHLCDALTEEFFFFGPRDQSGMNDIIDGRSRPKQETIGAIQHLTNQLRSQRPHTPQESEDDIALRFFEEVRRDLDEIVKVLIPRVVQNTDAHALIDALMEFDQAWRDAQNAIIVQKRVRAGGVYRDVLALNEKARNVYQALIPEWKPA